MIFIYDRYIISMSKINHIAKLPWEFQTTVQLWMKQCKTRYVTATDETDLVLKVHIWEGWVPKRPPNFPLRCSSPWLGYNKYWPVSHQGWNHLEHLCRLFPIISYRGHAHSSIQQILVEHLLCVGFWGHSRKDNKVCSYRAYFPLWGERQSKVKE